MSPGFVTGHSLCNHTGVIKQKVKNFALRSIYLPHFSFASVISSLIMAQFGIEQNNGIPYFNLSDLRSAYIATRMDS